MITEHDQWVFDNLEKASDGIENMDLDVNTFFDLMEDMVNKHYDAKEDAKYGHHQTEGVLAY
ncbi:MAG: hypothetical protein IJ622_06220 [Bacteroidales bacterium]|nr:hypothetical protein [Bacteroidales bacterium]